MKTIMNILAAFFINPVKRHAFRKKFWNNYLKKQKEKEVWGVSYSVFDGEELLEASIKSIRSSVDYVNVVYSLTSWFGEPANLNLLKMLTELKDKGLIDELLEFVPDLKKGSGRNEVKKRNMGLKAARKFGCTYFMPMDVDEFYRANEVGNAQELIRYFQITHSYCGIVTYGTSPTERNLNSVAHGVLFFSRLTFSSRLSNASTCMMIDPTRNLSSYLGAKHYVLHSVDMHHMTLVRRDFVKKKRNSSSVHVVEEKSVYPPTPDVLIQVPDEFNIGNIHDEN